MTDPLASASPSANAAGRSKSLTRHAAIVIVAYAAIFLAAIVIGIVGAADRQSIGAAVVNMTLLTGVGLIFALCSLCAVWWSTSAWPSHVKSLLLILAGLGCWVLLVSFVTGLVDSGRAGAWAIAFELQIVLAALASGVALWLVQPTQRNRSDNQQFTILYLLIWTTVIAIVLAVGRLLTQVFGWTIEVMAWNHFWPVQTFAVANGFVAGALLAVSISRMRLTLQLVCSVLAALAIGALTYLLIYLVFDDLVTEIIPVFVAHGAFLTATFLPLRNVWLRRGQPAIGHSPSSSAKT